MNNDQIRICDFTVYSGRNIYSHKPSMKMIVDIGGYGNVPTNRLPGFNEKLLNLFPGLRENCCGLGYPGGFLERLNEGTLLGHVLEHVILEMQAMLGYDVSFGRTRVIEEPSLYYLVYEYKNEVCGLECGKAAVFILNSLISGRETGAGSILEYIKKVSAEAELGPSTSAIVEEAKKQSIPVMRIGNECLVRLGCGRYSRLVESTLTDATSCISADISCNKQLTKYLLNENMIPVPYGRVVYSELSARMTACQIGMPVVIKPLNGNQGKGVHLNLKTSADVAEAFTDASQYGSGIIVEKFVTGRDFRVLVIGGSVRAVSERIPACVMGDGIHTVRELADFVNADPARGEDHEKPLTKIRIDGTTASVLKKHGMTPDSVPPTGDVVKLRENGNMSTGGTSVDMTDNIHPENADLAVRAAAALGIDIAGIDIVTRDISESIFENGGAVVEVNTAPGIRMHLYPAVGKARNVAKDIVDMLFPTEASKSFPIVSVTGTNGKTTVVRLVQHVLTETGIVVGMTSTSGTFVDGRCISRGDNSGPASARALLSNRSIEAAVLETARGGIIREGLGYDLSDVGVITNITEDHLGLDGVRTMEDLIYVKSLVAEAVKPGGAVVLNAEDPSTAAVLRRTSARPVLFAVDRASFDRYVQSQRPDFIGVFTDEGRICLTDRGEIKEIARIPDIPVTLGGLIGCNIENCLTAAGVLYALGVPVQAIRSGLMSFRDNSGRFSLFSLDGITIMLDYGHNPAGYEHALDVCGKLPHRKLIGVIGMPGDRSDSSIEAVGRFCAGVFDRIFIKEDADLRGRAPGEAAGILQSAVAGCGFPIQYMAIERAEPSALKSAVETASPGDLVVMFYEKFEPLRKLLEGFGAKPLTEISETALR